MSRIVYFDCPSGAAGDMIMASLLDAGVALGALRTELRKLPLTGWELVVREVRKGAFRATKVDVEIDQHAHHHHRTLGGGFVEGAHGRIPIPGPGTAELLRGFPIVDTGVKAELVTPTGAAILTTLASGAGAMPTMTVTSVGYGAGTRDLEVPNVLRCFVGETDDTPDQETIVQVETTIDDMSPQLYEPLIDRLFEAGALDVFLTPLVMKRSRPGVVLTALGPPGLADALARVLFEETTTIGVRWSEWRRARLDREMVTLTTAYGALPFKISRLDGRIVTVTPEFADVTRIARDKALPVREGLEPARAHARRQIGF